VTLALRRE